MKNIFLYITVILFWGSAWYAAKFQIDIAPVGVSLLYRCIIAAVCLTVWCKAKGFSLKFSLKNHVFLFLLGVSMFSVNYLIIYCSMQYIVSGVAAVVISCTSIFNIMNNFIFFRKKPTLSIIFGAFLGIIGLCLFFWPQVVDSAAQENMLYGLMIAGVGTFIFSLGGSIGQRNKNKQVPFIPAITMGMIYGAIIMVIYMIVSSQELVFPAHIRYWIAAIYLAIASSIIGTLAYLQLVRNMGQEFAGYATIVIPVVALIISSFFEGYVWSLLDFIGIMLIMLGNVLVMSKNFSIYNFLKVFYKKG